MLQAWLGVKPVNRRQGGNAEDLLAQLKSFPGAAAKQPPGVTLPNEPPPPEPK